MVSLWYQCESSKNLREQQGAESGHLLPLPHLTAAEAIDAVKAATARLAKRTIVAKGQEDTGIYQNFQRRIRYIESTVGENDGVSTRDRPSVREAYKRKGEMKYEAKNDCKKTRMMESERRL